MAFLYKFESNSNCNFYTLIDVYVQICETA